MRIFDRKAHSWIILRRVFFLRRFSKSSSEAVRKKWFWHSTHTIRKCFGSLWLSFFMPGDLIRDQKVTQESSYSWFPPVWNPPLPSLDGFEEAFVWRSAAEQLQKERGTYESRPSGQAVEPRLKCGSPKKTKATEVLHEHLRHFWGIGPAVCRFFCPEVVSI